MAFSRVPTRRGCKPSAIASGPADVQAFFDRWTARLPSPTDRGRSRRRLHPSARAPASRGQPHAGVCPAGAGPPLLRSRHPRESRPRAARPRRAPVSAPHHPHDAAARLGLSHARDHRWRRAQSPHRVQVLARQAVLQRAARASHGDDHQQSEGLLRREGGAEPVAPAGPGGPGQSQAPRSRTRQPPVCADAGRAGSAPAAHRRGRTTDVRAPLRRPARDGAVPSHHGFTHLPTRLPQPRPAPARRGAPRSPVLGRADDL